MGPTAVVRKLNDNVFMVSRGAVMRVKRVHEGIQHAALQGACADAEGLPRSTSLVTSL